MCDGAFPRPMLAAGLATLRAAAEDAEQMERWRALAKLHRPSQADAHVMEQLGTRLVEGLIAYLAARMAECAADPDGGVVLARLFAPPT